MAMSADERTGSPDTARIIYILYLIGLAVGLTSIVGVVMAYINKDDSPEWLRSHYQFQIRTFWIGCLYAFIGLLLIVVLIGIPVLIFTAVWFIVRCVKGLKYIERKEAYPNPTGWMF